MFGKTSVTIYFLPNSIQIFQLNSKRSRVLKYASFDLPDGVIRNHKVADVKTLSDLLKEAWKKLQIKEKSVYLIIPEFSTFTKLINLPGLKISELHEAVGWQIQDYLPVENQEMVMDFKIVRKITNGYKVLVVALEAKSLKDFVDSVESAGLLPLLVEIPSISLTRLTETDEDAKVIVNLSDEETVVVVARGAEIYASSIVFGRKFEEVEKNIRRIIAHFSKVDVKKLYVGGEGLHVGNMESIAKKFGLELILLNPKLKGISSADIQNYLVSYSSQLQTPSQPLDPTTLNLLPVGLVERYKTSKKKIQVWSLTLTTSLFIWISFFITLSAFLFMNQQIKDIKGSSTYSSNTKLADLRQQIENINKIVSRIDKVKGIYISPELVLNEILIAKPQGVTISSYAIDYDNGKVRFSGIAADRQTLVNFKQSLTSNPNFISIEMPITSFEADTNLEFEVALEYAPITSKIKTKVKVK